MEGGLSGPLPHQWETFRELLALDFVLAQLWLLQSFGEETDK